jgi:hypothetical protein
MLQTDLGVPLLSLQSSTTRRKKPQAFEARLLVGQLAVRVLELLSSASGNPLPLRESRTLSSPVAKNRQ